jgi:hypothetical protein
MPGERQNETRSKLDGMNAIPSCYHFDREAIWQKLDAQMQRRSKKKLIYWLPAAVFISAIIGTAAYFEVKRNQSHNNTDITITTRPKNSTQPPVEKGFVQLPDTKKTVIRKDAERRNNNRFEQNEILPDTSVSFYFVAQSPELPPVNPVRKDTVAVAATVQRPKFKIEHVNELDVSSIVLPPSPRSNTVFTLRKSFSVSDYEQPAYSEENIISHKKQKTLIASLTNSSQ